MTKEERERKRKELAAAALVLLLLGRTKRVFKASVAAIVSPAISRGIGTAEITQAISATSRSVVLTIRAGARAQARTSWEATTGRRATAKTPILMDGPSAQRAAASLEKQWQEVLASVDGDMDAALEQMESRFARTSETETMSAWNDEIQRQADQAESDGLVVTERWSSILDRATCAECAGLDGTVVVRPDRFDSVPPLHPRCRCGIVVELAAAVRAA